MARRHEVFINDQQWERIKPYIPKRKRSSRGGRPPSDDRACLEGILWVLRSGARWRDLPPIQMSLPTARWWARSTSAPLASLARRSTMASRLLSRESRKRRQFACFSPRR